MAVDTQIQTGIPSQLIHMQQNLTQTDNAIRYKQEHNVKKSEVLTNGLAPTTIDLSTSSVPAIPTTNYNQALQQPQYHLLSGASVNHGLPPSAVMYTNIS